jgi:hypothetical protein
LLQLVPVLIGITIVSFLLLRVLPGDPATLILGNRGSAEDSRDRRPNSASTRRCGASISPFSPTSCTAALAARSPTGSRSARSSWIGCGRPWRWSG